MTIEMPNPVYLIVFGDNSNLKICQSRQEVQRWLDSNLKIFKPNVTVLTGNLYKVDIRN